MRRCNCFRVCRGGIVAAAVTLGFAFVPDAAGQGLEGWAAGKKITLNTSLSGANVGGEVKNFPVPVILTSTNFDFTQAKSNGEDLRFTNAAGAEIPFQIETWDATVKKAAIWVKTDVKGNDNTQYIMMYWGNPDAASASNGKTVFSQADGWVGVWHLSEAGNTAAGGYKDATPSEAHATGFGFTAANTTDGRIGKCPVFQAAGRRYAIIGAPKKSLFDLTNKMTFSIWVRATSYPEAYITMFAKGDDSWRVQMFGIYSWSSHNGKYISEMCVESGGDACNEHWGAEVKPNEWNLLTVVHDNPNVKYYVNMVASNKTINGTWTSNPQWDVGIGCQTQGGPWRFWDGLLDEARVLNVPKDENWIKLNFESQKENSKFLDFGATNVIPRSVLSRTAAGTRIGGTYDIRGRLIKGKSVSGICMENRIDGTGRTVTVKRAVVP